MNGILLYCNLYWHHQLLLIAII